jgi:hypothetical protein
MRLQKPSSFPEAQEQLHVSVSQQKFTEYSRYLVLDNWRSRNRDAEWISAIIDKINSDMSNVEIGFLRRCIEATAFSPFCMRRVEAYGRKVPRFGHKRGPYPLSGFGVEDQIVCTYVDGVAAHRGLQPTRTR